jgi:membrane associated rhomboid family serine protease
MRRPRDAGTLLLPVALAAVAIVCCAALPLLAGAFAGLALGVSVGVGGGALGLVAGVVACAIFVRSRRRRSCPHSDEMPV